MTKNFRCLVAGAAMAIFFPIAAEAAPAGIVCKLQQFGGDGHSSGTVDLTFAYDGGATGALSATTPWGALNLPARLAGTIASGEFGINAAVRRHFSCPIKRRSMHV